MQEIQVTEFLQLQILASGMHLSPEFGMTIQEIRADGFKTDETVEILLSSDTPTAICKSMGLALIGYGEALGRLTRRFWFFWGTGSKPFAWLPRHRYAGYRWQFRETHSDSNVPHRIKNEIYNLMDVPLASITS
jgi:hypothetical protein